MTKDNTNVSRALMWKHGDKVRLCTAKNGEIIHWDADIDQPTAEEITAVEAEHQVVLDNAVAQKATDKASAKAKLIAGEALTEAEADTIVL